MRDKESEVFIPVTIKQLLGAKFDKNWEPHFFTGYYFT